MKSPDPDASTATETTEAPPVRVTRSFHMPIDQVFDAWLRPDQACKWLFATPTGEVVHAEIDPRVGGQFRIVDRRDGEDVEHIGEYITIERPHRIVFDFAVPMHDPRKTRVAVEIEMQGTGCVLSLTHDGVPEEFADRTRAGWGKVLDGLNAALSPAH